MRSILGTKPGGRSVDLADSGIWPLLWVNQGKAGDVPHESMNEDARNALHGRLANEVGAATVGKVGTAVMASAEREYERHYTATGQERAEIREARAAAQDAKKAIDEAVVSHEAIADLADEVRRLQDTATSYAPRIEAQRLSVQEASARAEAVDGFKSQLAIALAQEQRLGAEREQAADAVKRRAALEEEIRVSEGDRSRIEKARNAKATELESLVVRESAVAKTLAAAEAENEAAHAALVHVANASRKATLKREIDGKAELLKAIQGVADKVTAHTKTKASLAHFTDKTLKELRQLQERSSNLHAQVEVAAASITITAKKSVTIAGKAWSKGDSKTLSVTGPRDISIGDVVDLQLRPGGNDLAALRDKARDAATLFKERLAELSIANLTEAEQRNKDSHSAIEALEQLQERLDEMAPDGVEAIKADLATLRGEYGAIELPDELPTEAQAKKTADAAAKASSKLRRDRDGLQQQLKEVGLESSRTEQSLRAVAERIATLGGQLHKLQGADELDGIERDARRRWEEAIAIRNNARRLYEESGGDTVKLDHDRAVQALEGLERDLRKVEAQLHSRTGELSRAEHEGLYEKRQAAEAAWEWARAGLERRLREAAAAKSLWEALAARRRALQERLTKPVITRAGAYLEPLFPGCRLDMTDAFEIRGVVEGERPDEFGDLSGGEREQLSLVVRLALADVLRGDGTLPLLFDDSMVNTDSDRIQIVQSLLYRAARNLQIILFTCQGTQFDKLGADYHHALEPQRRGRATGSRVE